jgi:hypothetical protein
MARLLTNVVGHVASLDVEPGPDGGVHRPAQLHPGWPAADERRCRTPGAVLGKAKPWHKNR